MRVYLLSIRVDGILCGMATGIPPITFRLPDNFLPALDELAERYGDSRNTAARRLLVQALHDTATEELKQSVAELREELSLLREDLATVCVALLTRQQAANPQEAEAWVRENLLR